MPYLTYPHQKYTKLRRSALSPFSYTLNMEIYPVPPPQGIMVCCYLTSDSDLSWGVFMTQTFFVFIFQAQRKVLLKPPRTWRSISNPRKETWFIRFFYILWVLTTGNLFKLKNSSCIFSLFQKLSLISAAHMSIRLKKSVSTNSLIFVHTCWFSRVQFLTI